MKFTAAAKKLSFLTALFLSTPTFAAYKGEMPCPKIHCLQEGFYIGLQGGYDSYRVRTVDDMGEDTFDSTQNATSWVGGVLAGYGQYFNQFYLGGEIFLNTSSANNTDSFNDRVTGVVGARKFSVKESYGLGILPGIKFTESTLGYVRLGYNWAKVRTTQLLTGIPDGYNVTASNTRHGFAYGVGIETLLPVFCDKVSLRAEYVHTNYNSTRHDDIKFTPSNNQFMLGIIYHV